MRQSRLAAIIVVARRRRIIRSMTDQQREQLATLSRQQIVAGRYEPVEPPLETPEQRRARIRHEIVDEPWRETNGRDW